MATAMSAVGGASPILSIAANRLAVMEDQLAAVKRFYTDVLGMQVDGDVASFGPVAVDRQGSAAIKFITVDRSSSDRRKASAYWKIGIGLPDVNAAVDKLCARGVQVQRASQFLDVGFLTHMTDAAGYTIELLQDTFECNFRPPPPCAAPLACEAPKVGQVTLRVRDIDSSLGFYRDILGMRLLCWYPVEKYGFQLHFLAFSNEKSPDPDPKAVVNREWTYSRPHTTLELQSCPGAPQAHDVPRPGELGWQGMELGVSSLESAREHLERAGMAVRPAGDGGDGRALEVSDPDGYPLRLVVAV